jgi:hemerythrin superfamily protein
MTISIIDLLGAEHRHINGLFDILENNTDSREKVFEALKMALLEHSRSEEVVLYPQLEVLSDLQILAEDAREDHDLVNHILNTISMKGVDSEDFESSVNTLRQNVNHHVHFEESQIFPKLRQFFLPEELRVMADEFMRVEGRVHRVENVKEVVRNFGKGVGRRVSQFFS